MAVDLVVGRSVSARFTSPARARIAIAYSFCLVLRLNQLVLHPTAAPVPLLFSWHGSRPDGRSSGLSVWHRVGGSTRGASCTPSPSDTYFSGGSMINTPEFARRHFGMFVSGWNQTQVHAEGGPPSARCPRDARWVLGDRNSVQKVDSATCNFGTSAEVLSSGFQHTVVFWCLFHGHMQGRFLLELFSSLQDPLTPTMVVLCCGKGNQSHIAPSCNLQLIWMLQCPAARSL